MEIYVYAGWLPAEPLIGTYAADRTRSSAWFSYDADWLDRYRLNIDPALLLSEGRQYRSFDKASTFGFAEDASPDRWGRGLLLRNEQNRAREEKRRARTLLPEDFLLGVSDLGRQGGLRFKTDREGPFLADHGDIPKITEIGKLEHAAAMYEDPRELSREDWVRDLMSPGSSLGGARPKASVIDLDGGLWMAKFPSRLDDIDVGGWEQAAHQLAIKCGIHVPLSNLMELSEHRHTYLTKRFDRRDGLRMHYMSAMTALEEDDHSAAQSGKGFLDIAELLAEVSCAPEEDLKELFCRIAFTICISNTDCHFRNHAFLLTEMGWRLAPAYDMNPNVEKGELAIHITDTESALDLSLLMETAGFYRLTDKEAEQMISRVQKTVAENWRLEASRCGISRSEQEYMAPAFSQAFQHFC